MYRTLWWRKFKGGICRGSHLAVTYGVIVPPDIFIVKPAKQFRYTCVAFLAWTYIMHTFRLLHGKYAAMIRCANHAEMIAPKFEGTIAHLYVWPSKWPPPPSFNTEVKKRPDSPLKFLGCDTVFQHVQWWLLLHCIASTQRKTETEEMRCGKTWLSSLPVNHLGMI